MKRQLGVHLLHNPLAIALAVCAVLHPWITAPLNLFAGVFVPAACGGIALYLAALRNAEDALRMLFDGTFRFQEIKEIPWSDLRSCIPPSYQPLLQFKKTFTSQFARRGAGLNAPTNEVLLRVFIRHFTKPPFDHLIKSYSSAVGSSMLFLLDDPTEKMSTFSKFKFFHELAHISVHGAYTFAHRYRRLFVAIEVTLVAIYLGHRTLLFWTGLVLVLGPAVDAFARFDLECESKADALAISMMPPEERDRVLALCTLDWSPKRNHFSSYQDRKATAAFSFRLSYLLKNIESLKRSNKLFFGFAWNDGLEFHWTLSVIGAILLGTRIRPLTSHEALVLCLIAIGTILFPGAWLHRKAGGAEQSIAFAVNQYSTKRPEDRPIF